MVCFISGSLALAPHSSKQLRVYLKAVSGWMHGKILPCFIPVYFLFGNSDFWIQLCWLMNSVIQLIEVVMVCASQPCRRNSIDFRHYASIGNRFKLQLEHSFCGLVEFATDLPFHSFRNALLTPPLHVFTSWAPLSRIQVCRFNNWVS